VTLAESAVPSVIVNVALLPTERVTGHLIDLAHGLRGHPVFRCSWQQRPHLTLYMARFAVSALRKAADVCTTALTGHQAVPVRMARVSSTDGGYVEVEFERDPQLMELHHSVTEALAPLRLRKPVVESYYGPFTSRQRANVELTGYDLFDDLYRPHVTLARYLPAELPVSLPEAADLDFLAVAAGMFLADDNGAIVDVVSRHELQDDPHRRQACEE
jgi:hypothetical protein